MIFRTEYPFVPLKVTRGDLMLASLFMGFFVGFGYFATYHTVLETRRARRLNAYIFLCWGEILSCIAVALLAYLYLVDAARSSFGLFFGIATAWTFQVNFLLQIIVNRVCILLMPRARLHLKILVAALWTLICVSVCVIWIPTQLQINHRFEHINIYWNRTEKCLYLLTDGALNFFFIYTVKTQLINNGLNKYNKLVQFNQFIVFASLAMDLILIGLMSLPNHFVFCQFQSIAFIVKLNIEIAMSGLIIKVAESTGITDFKDSALSSIMNVINESGSVSIGTTRVRADTNVMKNMGNDSYEDPDPPRAKGRRKDVGLQHDYNDYIQVPIPEDCWRLG